ncbi:NAD-dependent epimerase/dehydratase family protein [Kribbella sancticallisti]|uniref:NAD-dependent epimerase/dehydratase family protein n=1 Tax=Kribbella sancticallisti TaxID=460087 RepID=A0ABP4QEZ4_9ACTN
MRIVITGATGNVGSALLRRLIAAGNHSLVGLARRLPEPGEYDEVTWHAADLTEDSSAEVLRNAFREADAVVHLAWAFQPSHDQEYLEAVGVGGTQRVLDAVKAAGVPHLVHMSSVGAYSPKRDNSPVDESWPTFGVLTSPYSQHKAAAERLLDTFEQAEPQTVVSRVRPGIIGQRSAGSALLRYGVPVLIPAAAIGLVPVVPLDRGLTFPMVHADDVADAIERIVLRKAPGAFNLAAEPPITTERIAEALDAKAVHLPVAIVRAAMSAGWHARLQQVDPGWLDLGFATPLLDTSRAARELDWSPSVDATDVLRETLTGMRDAASDRTAVLRPRTVLGQVQRLLRRGPISRRREP